MESSARRYGIELGCLSRGTSKALADQDCSEKLTRAMSYCPSRLPRASSRNSSLGCTSCSRRKSPRAKARGGAGWRDMAALREGHDGYPFLGASTKLWLAWCRPSTPHNCDRIAGKRE